MYIWTCPLSHWLVLKTHIRRNNGKSNRRERTMKSPELQPKMQKPTWCQPFQWMEFEWMEFAFTSSHINSTELVRSICKVAIESLSMILYYHKNKYINVYTLKFCIIFFYLSYDKCKSQSIQKLSLTCFLLANAFHWIATYSIKCCLNY